MIPARDRVLSLSMEALKSAIDRSPSIKKIARKLVATIPRSIRLGRGFWDWYAFYEESEQWTMSQMVSYQIQRLHTLLDELERTSAFYRERLADLDIQSLRTLQQFQAQVPTLTRSQFKENYPDILSSSWRQQKVAKSQTSGTTGMALQFYFPVRDVPREWAAICHQWKRVGYMPGRSKRAEFRGLTADDKLTEAFPHRNMIRCSILHLKAEHVRHYAEEIRKYEIGFYHGYPSALYLLAREICHSGLDFPQPKAILLASEMVYDWQLLQIQTAFPNAKLFAHYGCAEKTVSAGWCEHGQEYHVLPQYALVEIDPTTSEIIGTNLHNAINGFVRYRMTDTVLEAKFEPCPDCGRPYTPRLTKLAGRSEDYLYSPQNGWIPPAIVTYPLKALKAVQEMRFLQKEKDAVVVQYTVYSQADASKVEIESETVRAGLHSLFGKDMKFRFEQVDGFPRGPTGKFKWIICELDRVCPNVGE